MKAKETLLKNKKGAMEMSVGTIVTIVLLMSVLVLGIFLVQNIFDTGTSAVESIDNQMQNEINKMFSDEGREFVIYPDSREVDLKRKDDPKGFAIAVDNKNNEEKTYEFELFALPSYDFQGRCGISEDTANSYLLYSEGDFSLGANQNNLQNAEYIKFDVPENAPRCTIPYRVELEYEDSGEAFQETTVYLNIK